MKIKRRSHHNLAKRMKPSEQAGAQWRQAILANHNTTGSITRRHYWGSWDKSCSITIEPVVPRPTTGLDCTYGAV